MTKKKENQVKLVLPSKNEGYSTTHPVDSTVDAGKKRAEYVQILTFKCVKCGQTVQAEREPDKCINALCSTNAVTLEQKRVDEKELIKKHNIARLEGKLRRNEITKAEFDEAMTKIK